MVGPGKYERPHSKIIGVTLDRPLTYKQHSQNTNLNVAHPHVLRTSAIAVSFQSAEYAAPVWHSSSHAAQVAIAQGAVPSNTPSSEKESYGTNKFLIFYQNWRKICLLDETYLRNLEVPKPPLKWFDLIRKNGVTNDGDLCDCGIVQTNEHIMG